MSFYSPKFEKLQGLADRLSEERNRHPHGPAIAAMWLFKHRYHESRSGCMDFWDQLAPYEKRMCRNMHTEIIQAREETKQELSQED